MLSAVTKSGAQIQALNVADNAFGPIGAECESIGQLKLMFYALW